MNPEQSRFDFSAEWVTLGILTPERVTRLCAAWDEADDRNPEHYRWRAFRESLDEHRPVSAGLARALYHLGASDPDFAMGQSMMNTIVRLPEYPGDILAAAQSGHKHLMKIVERRRNIGDQP